MKTGKSGNSLPRMAISPSGINILHNKSPWMPMWWSAALPGLGHLCQGEYFRGIVLMSWEILVNTKARLNLAILYTFTGRFERAGEVLDPGWALFYAVIFCFAVYDSYRISVELNIINRLGRKQPRRSNNRYQFMSFNTKGINFIDRGNPWAAAAWSALLTGFGHLYNMKAFKAVILLAWAVAVISLGNINQAIAATFNGDFRRAKEIIDYQWALYFPSIYLFAIWDSYNDSVELNKLFSESQKNFLRRTYGLKDTPTPES